MKYVDMINEEGAFNIVSENKKIECNIVNIHPEFIFEDNSMLILTDVETYYDLIGDANICTPIDQDIDMTKLMKHVVSTDTVINFSHNGQDVQSITYIEYNGYKIYYLQRNGINPISNNKE